MREAIFWEIAKEREGKISGTGKGVY